jgi:TIR domain
MSGGVFICYRREDSAFAARAIHDRIVRRLQRENVFFDVDSIGLGVDWFKELTERVGACDALVAVIGRHWISSADKDNQRRIDDPDDFVRIEIETALKRDVRVIPLLVDGAAMPKASELPDSLKGLARRQGIEVSPARFEADVEKLTTALVSILEERRERGRSETDRPTNKRLSASGLAHARHAPVDDTSVAAKTDAISPTPGSMATSKARAMNWRVGLALLVLAAGVVAVFRAPGMLPTLRTDSAEKISPSPASTTPRLPGTPNLGSSSGPTVHPDQKNTAALVNPSEPEVTVKFNAIEAAVGRPKSSPELDAGTEPQRSDTAPPIQLHQLESEPTDLPKVGRVDTQSPTGAGEPLARLPDSRGVLQQPMSTQPVSIKPHQIFGVSPSKEVERQIKNPADSPRSSAPALGARNSETVEQSTGQEPGSSFVRSEAARRGPTCSLAGRWECVGCRNSYADVRELSGGPVREFEMTQNKTTTHGIFDVLEGKITLSDLQYDNQYITVGGIVSDDCKSVNWDFKHWAWSRSAIQPQSAVASFAPSGPNPSSAPGGPSAPDNALPQTMGAKEASGVADATSRTGLTVPRNQTAAPVSNGPVADISEDNRETTGAKATVMHDADVRASDDVLAKFLGTLSPGEMVTTMPSDKPGWRKVQLANGVGFVRDEAFH